ncbi:uncharacterized protein LOC133187904 isoform X4 [Saccostrea echinata]|uniref:uncharacterized protein LOC133187904 isoform X4 n=1 Tax=Saccostrea echinata TaxID=191078 RepID=UPI002A7F3D74|nr:uncharacterized protein LOC133187904 isoform X4 [Saccostrea echinata]
MHRFKDGLKVQEDIFRQKTVDLPMNKKLMQTRNNLKFGPFKDGRQKFPRTVPGKQGDLRNSNLIPGASQRNHVPAEAREKIRVLGPRVFDQSGEKVKIQENTTEKVGTPKTDTNQNNLIPQNDAPSPGNQTLGRTKGDPNSDKTEKARGLGPKSLPLTGSGSGYLSGKRSKLDCGDESAQDFRNSPGGYKCCLKSAKCFENLPEDIDEVTEAGTPNVGPAVGNVPEACGQIDQSLVCMARVLAKDQCKSAAEIVNKDLNEELLMVQKFYKQHCPGNSIVGTTPSAPHVPGAGGQGQMASSGSETSLPTSAVIGAAIGGLFFIILIVAIACFVRRKRSRLPTQDKVAFQSSPTTSARYKDFMRTNSEVYAEIDEKHLQRSFRVSNDTTTFEREEGSGGSTGSRPLPTAPSDGVYEDRAGYVTPRASRENLNDRAGYDALSAVSIDDENSAEPYDKLARNPEKPETEVTDGDYITPESGKPTEKIPDNYHTYFVLEK